EYLRRAGMSYTPALRDAFARSGAMAYQFILKARPAARQHSPLVEMVEKPLEFMQRLHATRLGEPRDAGLRVLQVVDQSPRADAARRGPHPSTGVALRRAHSRVPQPRHPEGGDAERLLVPLSPGEPRSA